MRSTALTTCPRRASPIVRCLALLSFPFLANTPHCRFCAYPTATSTAFLEFHASEPACFIFQAASTHPKLFGAPDLSPATVEPASGVRRAFANHTR